jgi:hypothetical protein
MMGKAHERINITRGRTVKKLYFYFASVHLFLNFKVVFDDESKSLHRYHAPWIDREDA